MQDFESKHKHIMISADTISTKQPFLWQIIFVHIDHEFNQNLCEKEA